MLSLTRPSEVGKRELRICSLNPMLDIFRISLAMRIIERSGPAPLCGVPKYMIPAVEVKTV